MKNYGIDIEKLSNELDGTEYQLGAISKCIFEIPEEERKNYLPIGEVQKSDKDDMQDCASRGPINIYENKFNYAYRKGLLLPESKKFLDDNGYVRWVNGIPYVEFADAWIAIKSGTTRQGNSLKAPVHACHEWGMVPKSKMPLEKWMTWEQYHDRKRITKEIEDIAKEFRLRFPMNYAQVINYEFGEASSRGSLDVAAFAWPFPVNGVYERVESSPNHAFDVFEFTNHYFAFDNYIDSHDGDFIKKLAPNYKFWDWGYHVIVTAQRTDVEVLKESGFLERLKAGLDSLLAFLNKVGVSFGSISEETTAKISVILQKIKQILKEIFEGESGQFPPDIFQPTPKPALLNGMAKSIEKFEDYVIPGGRYRDGRLAPEGSLTFRCKNPGACRFSSVGYLPKYGTVTEYTEGLTLKPGQRGFAKFSSYEIGFMYLKNLILQKAKKHPDWNLLQFFGDEKDGWAPTSDNNYPVKYAKFVASQMGVNIETWRIGELL